MIIFYFILSFTPKNNKGRFMNNMKEENKVRISGFLKKLAIFCKVPLDNLQLT